MGHDRRSVFESGVFGLLSGLKKKKFLNADKAIQIIFTFDLL